MHQYRKTIFSLLLLTLFIFLPCEVSCEAISPLSRVTFFGDSTTAHLALRGGIPKNRVWSGVGSTVLFETVNKSKCVHLQDGTDLTVAQAAALKRPQILVVTVGVSGGAGMLSKSDFTDIYRELLVSIRKASPETKLLVQSILPLSDKSVKYYKRLTKEAVLEANAWIRELCRELEIPYIDTHAALIDKSTGYLKAEYQNDEYMHLTAEAYTVVLRTVRDAITQLGYS